MAVVQLYLALFFGGALLAQGSTMVRINQVGYISSEPKTAYVISSATNLAGTDCRVTTKAGVVSQTFSLTDSGKSWNSNFGKTYLCDFSSFTASGEYRIVIPSGSNAQSPVFAIGSAAELYSPLLDNALFYFQASRDGPSQKFSWRPACHSSDSSATIYNTPSFSGSDETLSGDLTSAGKGTADVSGGWFDAGDYLKFVVTTSYVVDVLLFAVHHYPDMYNRGAWLEEAQFGVDWLSKMWDGTNKRLLYQVGIGQGNSQITADHDAWRLPEADDSYSASGDTRYLRNRPAFVAGADNSQVSPNVAGRLAAAFALCYQITGTQSCLDDAKSIFAQAKTLGVTKLLTAAPFDYYGETEWCSDMELGAIELYFAELQAGDSAAAATYLTQAKSFLTTCINDQAAISPLNLYDVGALAAFEVARATVTSDTATYTKAVNTISAGLDAAKTQSASDPFGLWTSYGSDDDLVPETIGMTVACALYEELTGDSSRYASLARKSREFVLGANGWGSSYIVGAVHDSTGTSPQCMQHQIDNLLNRRFNGAVVDGPNTAGMDTSFFSEARTCPSGGATPFSQYARNGWNYWDDVRSWSTNEPAIDYTAVSVPLFAMLSRSGSSSSPQSSYTPLLPSSSAMPPGSSSAVLDSSAVPPSFSSSSSSVVAPTPPSSSSSGIHSASPSSGGQVVSSSGIHSAYPSSGGQVVSSAGSVVGQSSLRSSGIHSTPPLSSGGDQGISSVESHAGASVIGISLFSCSIAVAAAVSV